MSRNLNLAFKLHIAVSILVIISNHFVVIDTISSSKNNYRHRKNELIRRLSDDQRQDSTIVDTIGIGGKIDRDDDGNFVSRDENQRNFDETGFDRMLDPPDYIRNYSKNMYSMTLDDYRQRVLNMFKLLEERPTQGCNTDPRRVFRFYCPTPHPQRPKTGWVCIKIDDLCNTIPDCPGAEDEDPTHCMYYISTQKQMVELRKVLIDIMRRPDQLRNGLNMEINNENSLTD